MEKKVGENVTVQHPRKGRSVPYLFAFIVIVNVAINFDSGAIPAVLETLTSTYGLSGTMIGILGALPYFGLMTAAPLVSVGLHHIRPKLLLLTSLSCNCVASLGLAMANRTWILFASRFFIGFTQSGFCIYMPVWIDEFAPENRLSLWMGLFQGATVMGVMVGYLTAGFLWAYGFDWRYSLVVQFAIICVAAVTFMLIPGRYIDLHKSREIPSLWNMEDDIWGYTTAVPCVDPETPSHQSISTFTDRNTATVVLPYTPRKLAAYHRIEPRLCYGSSTRSNGELVAYEDGVAVRPHPCKRAPTLVAPSVGGSAMEVIEFHSRYDDPLVFTVDQASSTGGSAVNCRGTRRWNSHTLSLLTNPMYMSLSLVLCCLLFVVTGVQYWSSAYLLTVFNADPTTVLISFSTTAASAPTVGVIAGGVLVDTIGGYKTTVGMFRTLLFSTLSASLASLFGFFAGFTTSFAICIGSIWFLLFFGALMMAPVTGMLIASVDPTFRSSASSFSMLLYNAFGYSLGTFLPGLVTNYYNLNIGMRFVFAWSILGVVEVCIATVLAWQRNISPKEVKIDFRVIDTQPSVCAVPPLV